jgi:hypothetical protein
MAADRPLPEVVAEHRGDDEEDDHAADRHDPPVAHLPPRLAGGRRPRPGIVRDRLDEDAALAHLQVVDGAGNATRVVDAAPERRVVERLAACALRVGVGRLRLQQGSRRDRRRRARRQHDRRPRAVVRDDLDLRRRRCSRRLRRTGLLRERSCRDGGKERGERRVAKRQSHGLPSLTCAARSRSDLVPAG